jgi:hypothetical protein
MIISQNMPGGTKEEPQKASFGIFLAPAESPAQHVPNGDVKEDGTRGINLRRISGR